MKQSISKRIWSGVTALFFSGLAAASAAEVSGSQAAKAARTWLARTGNPLECGLADGEVAEVETRTGEDGKALFHVVRLEGGGTVVTSGDTGLEPVVAFSDGPLVAGPGTPLGALLEGDMRQRRAELEAVRTGRATRKVRSKGEDEKEPEEKWAELLEERAGGKSPKVAPIRPPSEPSNVETHPLLGTQWGQGGNERSPASQYLPGGAVAGCGPVVMGQILAYYDAAKDLVESARTAPCTITVTDGSASTQLQVKPEWNSSHCSRLDFAWRLVPAISDWPENSLYLSTDDSYEYNGQRPVGQLLQVCGALLGATYKVGKDHRGTSASIVSIAEILIRKFQFNGATCDTVGANASMTLATAVNTIRSEVKKSRPVALRITGTGSDGQELEHGIIADGYGESGETSYTHLNMGWDGDADAWYNLQGTTVEIPISNGDSYSAVTHILHDLRPKGWPTLEEILSNVPGGIGGGGLPGLDIGDLPVIDIGGGGIPGLDITIPGVTNVDVEQTYIEANTPLNAYGTFGLTNEHITVSWRPYKQGAKYTIVREQMAHWGSAKSNRYVLASAATGTEFVDRTARRGALYHYTVTRDDGKELKNSLNSSIHVLPPKGFAVRAVTNGIKLAWEASEGAHAHFIYRAGPAASRSAAAQAPLQQFAELGGTNTTWTDTSVKTNGWWYRYGIRSFSRHTGLSDGEAMLGQTNVVQALGVQTNPPPLPPKPTLRLDRATNEVPSVKATIGNTQQATMYRLFRQRGDASEIKKLKRFKGTGDDYAFTDTNVWVGVLYRYWVETEEGVHSDWKTIRLTQNGVADRHTIEWEEEEEEESGGGGTAVLTSIGISGPADVASGESATYTCTARYSNGKTQSVVPAWSLTSGGEYGSLTGGGVFTALETTVERKATIQAAYGGKKATLQVTIQPKAVSPQTVTFRGNGGTPDTQSGTYTIGATYASFPGVAWAGHAFAGWWTAETGGAQVTAGSTVTAEAARTLYAHWTTTAPTTQTVTFRGNEGTPTTQSRTYTIGKTYGSLPSATRPGYAFAGWWTAASGGTQVTTGSTVTAATARTLFAHWAKGEPKTVWRFYSKAYKGHFFTISEAEKEGLIAGNANWTFEGGAYRAYTNEVGGTVALHRFYSSSSHGHFFTISESEKESLIAGNANWEYEGVSFYVFPEGGTGRVPVYRFWSKTYRQHFFTTSEEEKTSLSEGNPNWAYEGIAFWALPLDEVAADAATVTGIRVDATAKTVTLEISESGGRVKYTRNLVNGPWEDWPDTATNGQLVIPLGGEKTVFFGNP